MTRYLRHLRTLLLAAIVLAFGVSGTAQAAGLESIVLFAPGTSLGAERALVTAAGGQVTQQLHLINAVAARLDPLQAQALALAPQVASVSPDSAVMTQATSTAVTPQATSTAVTPQAPSAAVTPQAPSAAVTPQCSGWWAYWCPGALATSYIQSARLEKTWTDPTYGSTGQGIGVAVLDTGIAGDLPDFQVSQTNPASRVIASVVTNPNATTSSDLYGHGTHVAGILAGNSKNLPASDPNYNRYIGAAPNANLISVKVSDDHGNASVLDVINGMQFVVDHQADYNIRVVNLSLASITPQSYLTDPLDAAVEAAWLHGITVVTAAGNRGSAPDAVQYAPGNDPYVITVGAVDDQGTKATGDDVLAPWSSRGVTQDGFAKPDVNAPGVHIVAPLAPGSDFASMCPSCVRDGSYFQLSGTSMAAPVVSGLVADLLAAHPSWTPDQVKAALTYNAGADKTDLRATADGAFEVAGDLALNASAAALASYTDKNLVPNTYIDPTTGNIDYTKATWTKATWSSLSAADPLKATWTKATWTCLACAGNFTGAAVDPTKATWSAFFGDTPSS